MANRFQELFRLLPKLYSAGAPVMIEAGALQKDSATNRVLAQLKLRSLDPRRICACKVSVRAFEPNGTELDGVPSFAYLDIDVGLGENFGTKTPIYLPDGNSRSMSVSVIETVFSDGSVWQAEPCEWHQIPVQEAVVEHFDDPELIKQYELRVGGDCPLIPTVQDGLFLCTCGTAKSAAYAVQLAEAEDYSTAISYFTVAGSFVDAKERLTDAIYNYACQELSAGRFSHAKNGFMRCAGYKDADDKYNEAAYGYGCQLLDDKEYDKAVSVFKELGSYKDSASKQLEAKYGYVVDNKRLKETSKYYGYINDLVDARYKDSRAIYKEVYKWTANIYAINNDEDDEITNASSLSKYDTWYFHFELQGGPPNGTEQLYYKITYPDGTSNGKKPFTDKWEENTSGYVSAWYNTPRNGRTGTCTVTIYDSNGNQIGSASIKITN